jgi:hypothetical protein
MRRLSCNTYNLRERRAEEAGHLVIGLEILPTPISRLGAGWVQNPRAKSIINRRGTGVVNLRFSAWVCYNSLVVSNIDIWRAATLLIKQHGQDAEIVAARRVDELAEQEDDEGRAVWLRIRRAIVELQSAPTGPGH